MGAFLAPAGATQNGSSQNTIDTKLLGMDDFLRFPELGQQVGVIIDQTDLLRYLEVTNKTEAIGSNVFFNYLAGISQRTYRIAAVVTNTPASATIRLDGSSFVDANSTTGTTKRTTLLQRENVMFPGGQRGRVLLVAGAGLTTEFTINRRNGSTEDIGAACAALAASGKPFVAYSNSNAEASTQPTIGKESLTTRYQGQLQTFENHKEISGDVDSNRTLVKWEGGSDKYFSKALADLQVEHRRDVFYSMLLDAGGVFPSAEGDVPVQTGLEALIRQLGHVYRFTGGAFDLTDQDNINARVKAVRGGVNYLEIVGGTLRSQQEEVLRPFNQNVVNYGMWGAGDTKQRVLDLGINGVNYGGIMTWFQEAYLFSDPNVTGAEGFKYPEMAMLIPGANTKVTDYQNGYYKTLDIPYLTLMYKNQSNGESRRFKQWMRGQDITNKDSTDMEMFTQQGLRGVNMDKFVLVEPMP